jgi:flotillin
MDNFVLAVIGVAIAVQILLFAFYATRVKKVGPNEAIIISGRGDPNAAQDDVNFRVVIGGRSFIWPILERVDYLSLEIIPLEFAVATVDEAGKSVELITAVQIRIDHDWESIVKAVIQLLSKSQAEIAQIVQLRVEKQVHKLSATMSADQIAASPLLFAEKLQDFAADSLAKMGVVIDSCMVRQVKV